MTELMSALLYVEMISAYLLSLSFLPLFFYLFVVLLQYLFGSHSIMAFQGLQAGSPFRFHNRHCRYPNWLLILKKTSCQAVDWAKDKCRMIRL